MTLSGYIVRVRPRTSVFGDARPAPAVQERTQDEFEFVKRVRLGDVKIRARLRRGEVLGVVVAHESRPRAEELVPVRAQPDTRQRLRGEGDGAHAPEAGVRIGPARVRAAAMMHLAHPAVRVRVVRGDGLAVALGGGTRGREALRGRSCAGGVGKARGQKSAVVSVVSTRRPSGARLVRSRGDPCERNATGGEAALALGRGLRAPVAGHSPSPGSSRSTRRRRATGERAFRLGRARLEVPRRGEDLAVFLSA